MTEPPFSFFPAAVICHSPMSEQQPPAVQATGLVKKFGRRLVLNELDLRVESGRTVCLFGPNGAGKTTLLRVLATLLQPTAGSLELFGQTPVGSKVHRRLGFLTHDSFLYRDMTPTENLEFYARMFGLPDVVERVARWIPLVGLRGFEHVPVRCFSRGMEQRLALARVFLHEPALLLLDEPFTGLDAAGRVDVESFLAGMRRRGTTIILTTHDLGRGLDLAEQAVIMNAGRIVWKSGDAGVPEVRDFSAIYREVTTPVSAGRGGNP